MIGWLDLETSGLNPDEDVILEVAVSVTSDDLVEVGELTVCVLPPSGTTVGYVMQHCDPVVLKMHTMNDLWKDLMQPIDPTPFNMATPVASLRDAENRVIEYLRTHFNGQKPPMGGNTVGFDRAFLRRWMPALEALFHYRSIDVSSINELAKRWRDDVYRGRPNFDSTSTHRAMHDVRNSIAQARHYQAALFKTDKIPWPPPGVAVRP